jgi:hypothetical protein
VPVALATTLGDFMYGVMIVGLIVIASTTPPNARRHVTRLEGPRTHSVIAARDARTPTRLPAKCCDVGIAAPRLIITPRAARTTDPGSASLSGRVLSRGGLARVFATSAKGERVGDA